MAHIHWVLELQVLDGQVDAAREFAGEMSEATRSREPGALNYEWHRSEDGQTIHVYERFLDNDAVLAHGETFGPFAERFGRIFLPKRCVVYGDPSPAVQEMLSGFNPDYLESFDGFRR